MCRYSVEGIGVNVLLLKFWWNVMPVATESDIFYIITRAVMINWYLLKWLIWEKWLW